MDKLSRKLVEFGKKSEFNLPIALLCLFLINADTVVIDCVKHMWKKLYEKQGQRAVAMMLAVCVVFAVLPKIDAMAESETKTVTFSSFAQLKDVVKEQNVPFGTEFDMLNLPTSLIAFALTDSVVPEAPPVEITVNGVTWGGVPTYNSQKVGTYILTAILPNGYIVESGVSLPQITVIVSQAEQTAVAKAIATIDALPTIDEWIAMEETAARAVIDKVLAAKATFDALTEEEKLQIDELHTAKLVELAELASGVASAMPMAAVVQTGTSGTCTWEIDDVGLLTIRPTNGTDGTLGLIDNGNSKAPWVIHKTIIKSVIVETGVKANSLLAAMFAELLVCTTIDLSGLDTSAVTDMSNMFFNCKLLTDIIFGDNFSTAKVTNMSNMFANCFVLASVDLSKFDTSAVTNMSYMFNACGKIKTLSLEKFNTALVTKMSYMFYGCTNIEKFDLSSFDTKKVTSMAGMFGYCEILTEIKYGTDFNTAAVTDMSFMFYRCMALTSLDLSKFDTSSVTNMSSMFSVCKKIASLDLSSFNTSKVNTMNEMFLQCYGLATVDLSGFSTAAVTNMTSMFNGCEELTYLDLSNFDFTNVSDTNIANMFVSCNMVLKTDFCKGNMKGTLHFYGKHSNTNPTITNGLTGTETNVVYIPEAITKVVTGGTITAKSRISTTNYQNYFTKTAPLYTADGQQPLVYDSSKDYAQRGEVITITPKPTVGYILDTMTVTKTDDPTVVVTVTDNKFTMPDYPVTITANFKLPGYPVTITTNKDGVEWTDHGKTYKLTSDSGLTFITDLTAVPNGTYDIYDGDTKTGTTVTVNSEAISAALDYYTVTFYDGSAVQSTQIALKNGKATAPTPAPTKIGYTLKWVTTSGGSTEFVFANMQIFAPTSIYAKWTANEYTLTFNAQGGTVTPANQKVAFDAAYGTLPTPTKTGYTFKGWFTAAADGIVVTADTKVTATADHTIHAHWADETAPSAPVLKAGITLPTVWTKSQTTIPLTLFDGVGVVELWAKVDTAGYIKVADFTGGISYEYPTLEGTHKYQFKAKDVAGNTSTDSIIFTVKLDKTAPIVNIGGIEVTNGSKDLWSWIIGKKDMIIKVPVTDANSGVKSVSYTATPDSGETITKTIAVTEGKCEIKLENEFCGTIKLTATDNADNTASDISLASENGKIVAEDTAPTIGIKVGSSDVSEGYYETSPELNVAVSDSANGAISGGIKSIVYKIGNSETTVTDLPSTSAVYNKTFTIPATKIPSGVNVITITATDNAGNAGTSTVSVKVKGEEATPAGVIDYTAEKITNFTPKEIYIINNVEEIAADNGDIAIKNEWLGKTVSIIKKGNNSTTTNSKSQSLLINPRPATPSPVGKMETYPGAADGKITSVNSTMEYRKTAEGNAGEWTAITGSEVGVIVGTYEVRIKATANNFKSESATVTIEVIPAVAQATPEATFETSTMTLSNVNSEMKYSTDNGSIWKNISGTTADISSDTITSRDGILVIHKGNQKDKLDSKPKIIALTKKDIPTGIKSTNETADNSNDGTLTGVSTEMEYQKSGEKWTSIDNNNAVTKLVPATYNIRVKGSGYALQSDYVSVVIKPYNEVIIPVEAVTVSPNTRVLTLRQSVQLEATIVPENATNRIIKWTSSAPSVATVDGTGLVDTISVGKATITATTEDGNKKSTCLVTVKPSGGVEGIVSDKNGPVFGAEVEAREGGTDGRLVGGPILTDIDGKYSFSYLPQSIYSLVVKRKIATASTQTVTRIITVEKDIVTSDILMPEGETNTTVEVRGDTPAVAVDGLDSAFTNEAATDNEKGITADDAIKIEGGAKVDITLTAEKKEETEVVEDAGKIQESAGGTKEIGMLLDLSLLKTVTTTGAGASIVDTKLTGFNSLLKIVVPLSDSLVSKSDNLAVIRVHDGVANPIEKDGADEAERFTVEGENLILHVKNFSTYAVVNDKTIVAPPPIQNIGGSFANQNNEYTITATAHEGGTISPSGGVIVAKYSDETFVVTPDDGWKLGKVLVDGKNEVTLTDGKYTFKAVAEPYTIDAYFVKQDILSPKPIPNPKPNPKPITKPNKPVVDATNDNIVPENVETTTQEESSSPTIDEEKDGETSSSKPEDEEIAAVVPELPKADTTKSFCLINWIAGGNTQFDCWWCLIILFVALGGISGGAIFIIKRNKKK